ncbi:MAG: Gfo/Idh/MocA family oxidoreductase [Roseitalea sp.]|nr:Gfo/Idh/MocA family oxidoreductase [Roseitalea sp.]MBO6950298.1 Gfo/Idh/MocA family oxidoreductase [Rhizobiaceae bacterium]MBO6591713.1 Gfo/Idh/MocA family oxidoreductase [Roseitalea sp.]MBO6599568.1 Gfo/Idh/MocA family oxidoreductase [Roseitalea sp.]MBO6611944.1 Gfo/Idh/MocA family oxidoreductase [Roseitalea sp.]
MPHVAILGAGIGAQHMDGYRALPDRWKVMAVCDLDPDKADAVAAKSPGCSVTADIDEVLADPDIDVIDICLPPHLHAPVAIAALEAGKHVICEKPLAGSVRDADRMAAAADKAGRMLAPVFQYRYGRGLYQLAELQRRGLSGKPLVATLETHWNRGSDYYAVPWRGRWRSEGGGAVLGHAIHAHDLVTRFVGPVTEVTAMTDTRVNAIETEDCAALAMRCETGALVTSSVTLGGARDTSRLRFVFETLTAESGRNPYAPGADDWTFQARAPLDQSALDDVLAETADVIDQRPVGYAGQFATIADHLDGKPADMVTGREGVRAIELVAAVYKSARAGQTVRLPLDRADPICRDWAPEPPKGD